MAIATATRTAMFPAQLHQSSWTSETACRGSAELQRCLPLLHAHSGRRVDAGELARGLELFVLIGCRSERRAHALPRAVGVAVRLVDPVVDDARLARRERQAGERQLHVRVGAGHVVVVVVPEHDAQLLAVEAGERRDVRAPPHAVLDDGIERHLPGASHREPRAAHLAEHPEHVEHREVDAVRGERAEAAK
jgi:hypothetical protein